MANNNVMSLEDKKGNILILGNSGVGKSTLINAILSTDDAETGIGIKGTTDILESYDCSEYGCPELNMRFIDTPGFEPSLTRRIKIINSVRKWSDGVTKDNKNGKIDEIWFCVDGMAAKLFPDTIKNLSAAISFWKTVPIIVVITKSFSEPDRKNNIKMIKDAFHKQRSLEKNLKAIIPVVASTLTINDSSFAAPYGIPELIDKATEILPEGMKASAHDINAYKLQRKRILAQTVVGAATGGAVIVGAVPIPFSDAALLGPIEVGEVNGVSTVYGVVKDEQTKLFIDQIIKVGTVSAAAKMAISALKAIPGVNIGASVINAIIAGAIAAAIGEGSIYAFEQIYFGKKTTKDIDWITKFMESQMANGFVEKVSNIIKKASDGADNATISKMVREAFSKTD